MNQVEIVFNNQKIKGIWRDEVDESVWAEIFKWREYRQAEDCIKLAEEPILDIGAHAGFFALYCLALNITAKVFCLEPEIKNIAFFKRNLALNGWEEKVNIFPIALTATTGDYQLKISTNSHNHRIMNNGDDSDNFFTVAGISLSDFIKKNKIKKIGLIKLDIEGGEYELLTSWGANELSVIKNIILEYHEFDAWRREDLVQILRENGFGVQIFPSKFDKTMGIIFAHNKRI